MNIDAQDTLLKLKDAVVIQAIEELKEMKGENLLSGDDSCLKNTWEEICVQVQQEESFFWDAYITTIENVLLSKVSELPQAEKILLWLSTETGFEWQDENENSTTEQNAPQIFDDDIVQDLKSDLLSRAGEFENSRIIRFMSGDEDDFENDEDEEYEDEEGAEEYEEYEDGEIKEITTMNPMILNALNIANQAHGSRLLKGTNIPFTAHTSAVGLILSQYGCRDAVIIAGILHDISREDLTCECIGLDNVEVEDILNGFSALDSSLSWISRKLHTIEQLGAASKDVRLVAAADKLQYLDSIFNEYDLDPELLWEGGERSWEDQEWYYRSIVEALGRDGFDEHPLHISLAVKVDEIFAEIKQKNVQKKERTAPPSPLVGINESTNKHLIDPADILAALLKLANAGALKVFKSSLAAVEKERGSKFSHHALVALGLAGASSDDDKEFCKFCLSAFAATE